MEVDTEEPTPSVETTSTSTIEQAPQSTVIESSSTSTNEVVSSRNSEITPGLNSGSSTDESATITLKEDNMEICEKVIEPEVPVKLVQKNKKRCFQCNKKVGFTGTACKCEFIFCGSCRYPEVHNCTFDFKTHDRANLASRVQGGGQFTKIEKV